MEKVEYTCEIVTPVFMNGANKKIPELRASAIKGIMRYWWRAVVAFSNVIDMRKKEDEIFGSVDKKAKFSIQISEDKTETRSENLVPHREHKQYEGKNTNVCCRDAKVSEAFKINFLFLKTNKEEKELICKVFELVCILGGIGKRSRRGFGSIKIVEVDGKSIEKSKEFSWDEILKNLNTITKNSDVKRVYEKKENTIVPRELTGGAYPWIEKIEFNVEKESKYERSEEIVKDIGFCAHNQPNYTLVQTTEKRYASPIYVSVIEKSKRYYPIVTTLHSEPWNEEQAEKNKENREKFIKSIFHG